MWAAHCREFPAASPNRDGEAAQLPGVFSLSPGNQPASGRTCQFPRGCKTHEIALAQNPLWLAVSGSNICVGLIPGLTSHGNGARGGSVPDFGKIDFRCSIVPRV
jgi:hypothetical protein